MPHDLMVHMVEYLSATTCQIGGDDPERATGHRLHHDPVRSNYSAAIQIGTESGFGRGIERDFQSERRLDARAAKPRAPISSGPRVR